MSAVMGRTTLRLSLPSMPPSVNHMYANNPGRGRCRYRTAAYKAWIAEAGVALMQSLKRAFTGPVSVTYEIGRPHDRRRRDLGNYEKALSDLLVKHGVLKDDSNIVDLHMRWIAGDGVHITVKEASP